VVAPDEETDYGDGQAGESDKVIATDILSGETGNQLAAHAHAWQDHDVNGRMGVKPEKVLEQDRISTESRIKNPNVEAPLQNQQHQRDGHDRRPQDHDETGGIVRPDEKRQAKPGQAWSTHRVDCHDEVQTRQYRGEAGNKYSDPGGDDIAVGVSAAVRSIKGPPCIHSSCHHCPKGEQSTHNVDVPTEQIESG